MPFPTAAEAKAIELHHLHVFTHDDRGGNPLPLVLDARSLDEEAMRGLAAAYGHESAILLPATDTSAHHRLRFFVPQQEMEMCGHAAVGATWMLARLGRLDATNREVIFETLAGRVHGRVTERDGATWAEVSQPAGTVERVGDGAAREAGQVLGIAVTDMYGRVQNASTSRVKTCMRVRSVAMLNELAPDLARMPEICGRLGSTGLYPYAVIDRRELLFEARQFPKASGYPEDAATGIAAAALAYALLENCLVEAGETRPIRVMQGRAMGCLSEISVRYDEERCWLGGRVRLDDPQ